MIVNYNEGWWEMVGLKISKPVKMMIGGLVGALLVAGGAAATAVVTSASGTTAKFEYVSVGEDQPPDSTYTLTQSTTYADVPSLTKTFTQGGLIGTDPALVLVNFQFGSGYRGYVRLVVDGTPLSGSERFASGGSTDQTSDSWNFATEGLAPGSHTIKVQWKAQTTDDILSIYSRTMTIVHK